MEDRKEGLRLMADANERAGFTPTAEPEKSAGVEELIERLELLAGTQIVENLDYIRSADAAMSEAASALSALQSRTAELERKLFPHANANPICGFSYNGFYFISDEKGIKELHRLENNANQIETWRRIFDENLAAYKSRAERAEAENAKLKALVEQSAGPTHRHRRRGSEYVLVGIGKMQAEKWKTPTLRPDDEGAVHYTHVSIDMREVAVYRSVADGSLWVRPREEFEDGRFETLVAEDRTHG